MKKYLIYKFTSPSGKSYIGQTCDLEKRKSLHKSSKNCIFFHNAIEKYGLDNFIEEILEDDLSIEEANIIEELYIAEHNTLAPNGYNLKSGGKNYLHSEETKQKMRESHHDNSGENHHMFGKHHSEETREKMSNSRLGDKNPMFGMTGENHPAHYRTGDKNSMFGRTGENNQKSKKYIITFPDGHEEIIIGLREFCRNNNLNAGAMCGRGHHKGFKCRYFTEAFIVPPLD